MVRLASRFRRPPRLLRLGLFGLLGLLAFTRLAAADLPLEYRVKAGFIYNFAKFVEWPADSLPPGATLRLAIVGTPDLVEGISQALAGKIAAGHAIEVQAFNPAASDLPASPQPATPPHILFVQRGSTLDGTSAAALFTGQPVLVIGETPGFAEAGGTIGFVLRGDTLRFQVNLAAANQAGLQLNSQLANMAEIVRRR